MGALTDDIPGALAAILPADPPSPCVNCDDLKKIDYRIELKKGGNRILTPLEIPDFKELPKLESGLSKGNPDPAKLQSAQTKNKETIDFVITRHRGPADSLTLEVLDGFKVIYAHQDMSPYLGLPKNGASADWQWDGYSNAGVLDTRQLKSQRLKIRLTATLGGKSLTQEIRLHNNNERKIDWVDAKIDRIAKTVEITVRPSFSDGGVTGEAVIPGGNGTTTLTPVPYSKLLNLAKNGIEKYWSRDGSRSIAVAAPLNSGTPASTISPVVTTAKNGVFKVSVKADVNIEPKAATFRLIERLGNADVPPWERSTSLNGAEKVFHYLGLLPNPDDEFEKNAAHEFGHLIMNAYGANSLVHKGTSTAAQFVVPNPLVDKYGEVDVMHYFSEYGVSQANRLSRTIAAEDDVMGLIWINRIYFND
jgi:hypothetical protein